LVLGFVHRTLRGDKAFALEQIMDFDVKKFKEMSPADLAKLVEHLSDEYRAVITVEEYFDAQTGACAVLQKKGGGADTRKFIQMNSGLQSESRVARADRIHEIQDWAKKNDYELKPHAEMVEPGPIGKQSKKKTSSYTKALDGSQLPYDPKAKIGADGELTVLKHHAEMKILHWAEGNGYDVVALAPTRHCCPNCHHELTRVLGGEEKFKSVVPPSRQTPQAYSEHLQNYLAKDASKSGHGHAGGAAPHGEPALHSAELIRGGGETKLPQGLTKFPALAGKLATHLGTAATAFDALNTASDVGKDLRAGHTEVAARKTLEFGGRTWGGIEGAAIGAEIGGAVGSVVPGAGTLIGAAAGGVIGGIVGPTVGEEIARKLFDGMQKLGPHPSAPDGKQHASIKEAPSQREAQTLQRYFFEATSAAVGQKVGAMHHANPAISNEAVFEGLKAHAADVFKPVAAAGEKLAGSRGYRSEAVVQALEGKNSGKNQSGQQGPGVDDPLTAGNVVGTILGDKPGTQKHHRGFDPNKQHTSPLDRQHD
jgi:hypothetical protein